MAKKIELTDKDYLCILGVLLALRKRKGLIFSEIQKKLQVDPNQLRRILELLRNRVVVWVRAVHPKDAKDTRILAEYELAKSGESVLKAYTTVLNLFLNPISIQTEPKEK